MLVDPHLRLEPVELCLGDGLNLFNDTPFDTFRAGGRGEGTIITPVVRHVNRAEELAHIDLTGGAIDSIKDTCEEGVVCGAAFYLIKEDSNDSAIELLIRVQGLIGGIGSETRALDDVHKMELGIVKFSINSVFGGCVEVELLGSEVRLAAVGERDLELGISAENVITKVNLLGEV